MERPEPQETEHEHTVLWRDLNRIAFVLAAACATWFLRAPTPLHTGIGVLRAVVGGYPIYRGAIENSLARRMTRGGITHRSKGTGRSSRNQQ